MKKLKNLQQICKGYESEKRAWEENLSFFKNPLSLTSVESIDCAFEGVHDTATLSKLYDAVRVFESVECRVDLF